jgi:hypothetical protein
MAGRRKNKARSAVDTPEQHQEVDFDEEGEVAEAEDQQDEQVFSPEGGQRLVRQTEPGPRWGGKIDREDFSENRSVLFPSAVDTIVKISTFELRSRIAFWLDSLEQRKHLERIEKSNSIFEIDENRSI